MAQIETLGIIEEIESLVSDKLQVVSYKWLSRSYMVSSNVAKRLLQEFAQKHGNGLEVIYTLSGWLKSSSPCYHIRLVTAPKLAEAQEEFDGNCSVQVYSVQASIPKDPAMLWNGEFIQAEELFNQPFTVDNCLRDNRFCAVSSSFVRRNVNGTTACPAVPQTKSTVGMGLTKSNIIHQSNAPPQPQHHKADESVAKVGLQALNAVKDVKTESYGAKNTGVHDQASKPSADKEKVHPLPTGKKKVQADKSSSATSGSLANFWGRAAAKSKPSSPPAENSNTVSNAIATTAEAQICAHEAEDGDSSDDDSQSVTLRRSSSGEKSRKRRVVLDFSDEDEFEDAVNLASPDFPPMQSAQDNKQIDKKLPEKATVNFDMQQENKSKVKEERTINKVPDQPWREDFSVINKCTSTGKVSSVKSQNCTPEIDVNKKDDLKIAVPASPKRRKMLKTRIDERGREVNEVVWEGEETEAKKADDVTTRKADNNVVTDTLSRPPAAKKSIANTTSNPNGKGGSKKAGNSKDPKQGNILSFFKKV